MMYSWGQHFGKISASLPFWLSGWGGFEINEDFGAQTLACAKELEIPIEKLNTCGGAIALGHPLAASGSRISAHIVHKLRRNGEKYGIGSACIGGGQGISILFEAM